MKSDETRLSRPFEVGYDTDNEEYYIFAPAGCVLVDGQAAEIEDADQYGNVSLAFGSTLPSALYAHVTKDSGSAGGYKVEFDANETKNGAKYNFKVTDFGNEDGDAGYDVATGVVSLGGSYDEPFDYVVETEEGEGGEEIEKYVVKASSFYFDGVLQTIDDDLEIEQVGSVTAYLICYGVASKNADDEIEYTWTFSLDDEPQEADEPATPDDPPDKVLNVKLYDFEDGAVVKDYRGVNLPVMSGAPVATSIEDIGVFAPVYSSSTGLVAGFKNCYYQIGGFSFSLPNQSLPIENGFVCLQISSTSASPSAQLVGKATLAALQSDQANLSNVVIPFYKVSGSQIEVDLRRMPTTGILEFFQQQSS